MKILVAGATGSIGIHVVNTAIAMGHQPVALVRNRRKIKLLPRGTDIFYGDVSIPETLTDLPKDIDAVTNGAIVIHTQRLKSDPGGNLLS